MNEPDSGKVHEPAELFPERPRLGIRHLLLWTACAAVYLLVHQGFYPRGEERLAGFHAAQLAAHSVSGGTLLVGLLLWGAFRIRKVRFPSSEGELLWLILGIVMLAGISFIPMYRARYRGVNSGWESSILIIGTVTSGTLYLVAWVRLLLAAFRTRKRLWRALFVVLLALPILQVFWCCGGRHSYKFGLYSVTWFVFLSLNGSLTAAVLCRDWRQTPRPPWTHWVGILCCGWQTLVAIVITVVNWIVYAMDGA
jgi:hypothetical protein